MSVEVQKTSDIEVTRRPPPRTVRAMRVRARKFSRAVEHRLSSALTRRIVVLNLGGLVALLVGFLYLNQFRAGLIDARVQSLATQGEIIASAIAASATVDSDEFSIDPERVGPLLRRLVSPTRTRARIYDRDGYLLIDSRSLTSRSTILRSDLPAPNQEESQSWLDRLWAGLKGHLGRRELPIYEDIGAANGKAYPEVSAALSGGADSVVRMNAQGETIVSVAVPIQRFRTVRGALLLSTQGGDIDQIIASERWAIIRIFVVSAGVMLLLSLFFAGTVAEPMRRLAEAADRVRRGIISRQQIPDLADRPDEIGNLSAALRD